MFTRPLFYPTERFSDCFQNLEKRTSSSRKGEIFHNKMKEQFPGFKDKCLLIWRCKNKSNQNSQRKSDVPMPAAATKIDIKRNETTTVKE